MKSLFDLIRVIRVIRVDCFFSDLGIARVSPCPGFFVRNFVARSDSLLADFTKNPKKYINVKITVF